MHGAGKFGLASLCNLDQLPPTGAVVIAAPLKIVNGSGSPLRVLALVPKPWHRNACYKCRPMPFPRSPHALVRVPWASLATRHALVSVLAAPHAAHGQRKRQPLESQVPMPGLDPPRR